jgi:hypothetical protein
MFLKVIILYFFTAGGILGLISKLRSSKLSRYYLGSMWFLPRLSGKFSRLLGLFYGNTAMKY